jgi:AcrR family transcriptional regulator
VSRGTFYRYFSSQGDLLDAFSRHKRDNFHSALLVAAQVTDDPDRRFRAVVAYLEAYLESGQARRSQGGPGVRTWLLSAHLP